MITQEEIPYTKKEIEGMVKTIQQLRKEKQELLDKVCDWLEKNLIKELSIIYTGNVHINITNVINKLRDEYDTKI